MSRRQPRFCQFILLTVAAAATGSCSVTEVPPNRAQFGATWKSVDCQTFDVPDSVAAQSDCGHVTVPEQHGQPQERTIQLGVVRTRSNSKTPAADPLFVEQGGPGNTTIGVFANGALPEFPELKALLESRDLIFMEKRGTQYAKPFLSCPEFNAHAIAVAQGEQEYTDPGWIRACHDRFKAEGINPNAFNTRENAR